MKNIILMSTVLFLISCGGGNNQEQQNQSESLPENTISLTDAQFQLAHVGLSLLEKRDVSSVIRLNGVIDVPPQNMISVSMPLGGYLQSTHLLPGMAVRKGEKIGIMEDQQYIQLQQDYLVARSNLEFAEAEYTRQKTLNQSKAISDKVFQQAQMEYNNQKIAMRALSEKLKLININPNNLTADNISRSVEIHSPIDGFVSKIDVNIGKYVNPSDVLFELVNPADIHLNLRVFEKDVARLSVGQRLNAYTNDQPERIFPCKIILISQNISDDRTIEVHCHFDNYNKALIPGMYMNAEVELENKNTYSIQEEAVVNFEGMNYVFVQTGNNQFQMTPADLGSKENGFVEVLNDSLFTNKQIVTNGAYTILMKLKNISDE